MNKLIMSVNNFPKEYVDKQKIKILKEQKNKCHLCDIKLYETDTYFLENNTAICSLCYTALNMQLLNEKNQGRIIMLPELSQADLLNLLRSIYYIKSLDKKYNEDKESIELIEQELIERSEIANHYFAKNISNPFVITQIMLSLSDEEYDKREKGFFGLRWMPELTEFKTHMDTIQPEINKYHPKNWNTIVKNIKNRKN
jgi:hypothetical protein